jgi:hypothetical protein
MKQNLKVRAMNGRDPAKSKSNPFDFYPTPRSAVLDVLSIAKLPAGSRILEPCAGDGAIAGVLEEHGCKVITNDIKSYGFRLDTTVDFLTHDLATWQEKGIAAVVTNPPFRMAEQFIHRSLIVAPTAWMLLRLQFLESQGRNALLRDHLAAVHVYSKRLTLAADGTNAMAFAWFKFTQTRSGNPTVDWILRPSRPLVCTVALAKA